MEKNLSAKLNFKQYNLYLALIRRFSNVKREQIATYVLEHPNSTIEEFEFGLREGAIKKVKKQTHWRFR